MAVIVAGRSTGSLDVIEMGTSQHLDIVEVLRQIIERTSGLTLVLIAVGAVVVLIAANVVIARNFRRRGEPPWSWLNPLVLINARFSAAEWGMFLALAIVWFAVLAIAVRING